MLGHQISIWQQIYYSGGLPGNAVVKRDATPVVERDGTQVVLRGSGGSATSTFFIFGF